MTSTGRPPPRPRPPTAGRPPTPGRRRDRGAASVQLVVLMPVLFTLMFVGMQAALIYHGRTVAIAAAQEGARAAAAQHASSRDGQAAAAAFVTAAGGEQVLARVGVRCTRAATSATVTVTGTTLSVLPGWTPQVTGTATAPVERLT